jgi:hypothetical protein
MKHARIALLAALCLTASFAFAQAPATHGVALSDIDHSIKPGDKLYLAPADRVHIW